MRFIRHSWVESFRNSHYAGMVSMEDYFKVYHTVVKKIFGREGAHLLVAFNPPHPSQIFGFCCYETGFQLPLIHYIYVKEDFRRLPSKDDTFKEGIATMLIKESGIDPKKHYYHTFKTGVWAKLSKRYGPFSGGVFRPQLGRFPKDQALSWELEHPWITKTKTHSKEDRQCA
mgnify:CR=1 FL=1